MSEILIIVAINFITYFRTLKYGYVSDDIPASENPKPYKNIIHKAWLSFFEAEKYNIQIDHLITILLHTAVSVMIYVSFGMTSVSFLAAILFSINPVNNQGSIWISGRGYVMPTLLILISMVTPFFISAPLLVLSGKYVIGYYGSLVFFGSPFYILLCAIPAIAVVNFKQFKSAVKDKLDSDRVLEDKIFHYKKIILAIKTYGYYLCLSVIPFRICFLHSYLQSASGNEIMKKKAYTIKDRFFWIGLVAIIGIPIYSIYHWDNISWGILWFSIGIAPFSNLVRMQQEVAERYCYFPCVGLMLALSTILINYPIIAAALLGYYYGILNSIMGMYKDDYWLIEYNVVNDYKSWFAWHIRAIKKFNVGAFREAFNLFMTAYMISPKEFKILVNIATCLKIAGKNKEAEAFLEKAQKNILPGQEEQASEAIENFKKGNLSILL